LAEDKQGFLAEGMPLLRNALHELEREPSSAGTGRVNPGKQHAAAIPETISLPNGF